MSIDGGSPPSHTLYGSSLALLQRNALVWLSSVESYTAHFWTVLPFLGTLAVLILLLIRSDFPSPLQWAVVMCINKFQVPKAVYLMVQRSYICSRSSSAVKVDPTGVVNHETRSLAKQSHVGYSGVGDVGFSVAATVGGGEEEEFTALAIAADAERMCSRRGRSLSRGGLCRLRQRRWGRRSFMVATALSRSLAALQNTCLKTWGGRPEHVKAAQDALLTRAKANSRAQLGKYTGEGESAEAKEGMFVKRYVY
ncbi:hypothetical protein Vadar_010930 [Vaccinium darrowii]|uniref:Uncharacterized protein n=1 Tax=Vaccinium darrowii TaxID=229202 RepID=A0ACB7Z4I9_9ERIC|nr:hypothetical protein Vadar_010930 [Vaccinium darrowii]